MESDIRTVVNRAKKYLWDNLGNMLAPGVPRFDEQCSVWCIPILCRTERGIFAVGELQLDTDLNIVHIPAPEEVDRIAAAYVNAVPVLVYAAPEELRSKGFEPVTV